MSEAGNEDDGFWNVMTSLERRLGDMRTPGVVTTNGSQRSGLLEKNSLHLSPRGGLREAFADLERSRAAARVAVNSRRPSKELNVMSPIRIPGTKRESSCPGSLFTGKEAASNAFDRGSFLGVTHSSPKTPGSILSSPRGNLRSPRDFGIVNGSTPSTAVASSRDGLSSLEKLRHPESFTVFSCADSSSAYSPRVDPISLSPNKDGVGSCSSDEPRTLRFSPDLQTENSWTGSESMHVNMLLRESSFTDTPVRAKSYAGENLSEMRESSFTDTPVRAKSYAGENGPEIVSRQLEFSGLFRTKDFKVDANSSTSTDYVKSSVPTSFRSPRHASTYSPASATGNVPFSPTVSSKIPATVFSDRSSSSTMSGGSGSSGFETQTSSAIDATSNSNTNGGDGACSSNTDVPSGVSQVGGGSHDEGGLGDAGASSGVAANAPSSPRFMSQRTDNFWAQMSKRTAAQSNSGVVDGSPAPPDDTMLRQRSPSLEASKDDLLTAWRKMCARAEAPKPAAGSKISALSSRSSSVPSTTPASMRHPTASFGQPLSFRSPLVASMSPPSNSKSSEREPTMTPTDDDPTRSCPLPSKGGVAAAALKHASSLASERSELQRQLSKAEADMERMSRTMEQMRRGHEMQIASIHKEKDDLHQALEEHQKAELEGMRLQVSDAFKENHRLHLEIIEERRRIEQLEQEIQSRPAPTAEGVAPVIAELETQAFKDADADTRAQFKRRLQLKWHPDKCINGDLAKCVMQELQRVDVWNI